MSLILLFSFIILYGVVYSDENNTQSKVDYCLHPDCPIKDQHTLCAANNKASRRLYVSGMTTWMRYQILLLHNRHRDNIAMGLEAAQPPATNMRKLYWDYELEEMAEVWARQCQKRHDECRNTIRFNALQNMDVRPVVPRVTEAQLLADAVGAWFSGSRSLQPENVWSFKLSNCSAPGGCNAHWYSAAAWASTWRLGCSQALCTVRKPSCVLFRKRRRARLFEANDMKATTTSSTTENILRRTRYMTSGQASRFEDFATTVKDNIVESPLYRGAMDNVSKRTKRRDLKIIAFTFCNYGPAGNIEGFPIYEAGTTCANCPQGTHCRDRTHRALCSVVNDPDGHNKLMDAN
ncbi:venom allergen 5 [Papilio machaon]|uniref:venom allergen 5 n=1 Tax=Papilio machaon TaxID=76193 RepID=UPI001E665CAB|nr:venom allergen 5 [Papilio machaon]